MGSHSHLPLGLVGVWQMTLRDRNFGVGRVRKVRWAARPLLTAASAIALGASAAPSLAQESNRPVRLAQADTAVAFDIPAQSLGSAVTAFGLQSGYQVSVDDRALAGLRSPGASGTLSPMEALSRLLSGTGVTWRLVDTRSVALEKAPSQTGETLRLGPVRVEGGAVGAGAFTIEESATSPVAGYVARKSATGTKTDTLITDVPQAINVVTADEISARASQTLIQTLRYTPGVVGWSSDTDVSYDNIRVRGFANLGQFLDGMHLPYGFGGSGQLMLDPYLIERVEVLKGPPSVLYGQSYPGGLVNSVTKRPSADALNEVQVRYGSFERKLAQFDLGGALDTAGALNFRLVGVASDGGTQVDDTNNKRLLIAPAVTWRPDSDTSLTALGHYQKDRGRGGYQLLPADGTLRDNPNGPISRDRLIGDPSYDQYRREQWLLGYMFEHRFSPVFTFRQNLRYVEADIAGQVLANFGFLPGSNRSISRIASRFDSQLEMLTVDTHLQADFATGDLTHRVLVGVDYQDFNEDYRSGGAAAGSLDLYAPSYNQAIPVANFAALNRPTLKQTGVYLQDEVTRDRLTVLVGGRLDWAKSQARTTVLASGAQINSQIKDDAEFSGRAGLLYRLDGGFTPYISYSTAFVPTSGADYEGTPFRPSKGEQIEAGVKFQPEGLNSLTTLSVFQIDRTNLLTTDTTPGRLCAGRACQVQSGAGRVRGVELESKIEFRPGANLVASYAYTDGEYTRDNPNSAGVSIAGNRIEAVPRHQFAVWGDYRFDSGPLSGFGLGAGVRHTGAIFGEPANDYRIPSWTLVDAAVTWDLARLLPSLDGTRLQVNASNLFDKRYVTICYSEPGCLYGEARTVSATLSYRW